jgi:hypothetical protein
MTRQLVSWAWIHKQCGPIVKGPAPCTFPPISHCPEHMCPTRCRQSNPICMSKLSAVHIALISRSVPWCGWWTWRWSPTEFSDLKPALVTSSATDFLTKNREFAVSLDDFHAHYITKAMRVTRKCSAKQSVDLAFLARFLVHQETTIRLRYTIQKQESRIA